MILDTLKESNSTMLDYIRVTEDKQAIKVFKEQIADIDGIITQLDQILNVIVCLEKEKITKGVFTEELKNNLLITIDKCGNKIDDHSLDEGTVLALKNICDSCKNTVSDKWKNVSTSKSEMVVSSLTSLRSLLTDYEEIDDIVTEIKKARVHMPTSSKEIKKFLANIDRGTAIVNELHLDKETEEFVDKVKLQCATVEDLTPHILKWIKDNNLMKSLKIRF